MRKEISSCSDSPATGQRRPERESMARYGGGGGENGRGDLALKADDRDRNIRHARTEAKESTANITEDETKGEGETALTAIDQAASYQALLYVSLAFILVHTYEVLQYTHTLVRRFLGVVLAV